MKSILINIAYYFVLFFKYFYIYTHNFFTWFYNLLAKVFKWNVRFYYAQEQAPADTTLNKIKAFFSFKKKEEKDDMATDYKQKYLQAQKQSDNNFARYKYRKEQEHKNKKLYEQEAKRASELHLKNQALQKQIQQLKNQANNQSNTNSKSHTSKAQNTPDNRTAMEILGVSNGFTPKELKDAYKRLTSRYHPDKHIHMSFEYRDEAETEFGKIQNAYNKIK